MITKSDVFTNISDFFISKPTLHSDSQVMGIPVWVIISSSIGYIWWNIYEKREHERILQNLQKRVDELEREQKDDLRREVEMLRNKLKEYES